MSIGYILQIALYMNHAEYILYCTTVVGLILFAVTFYYFYYVFLPVYDRCPESHFQVSSKSVLY